VWPRSPATGSSTRTRPSCVHGSIELARTLLRAGLVDELQLVIAPAIAYRGRRLFDGGDDLARLELGSVDRSPGGALFCGYRVVPGTV
jgi:dihydrofolate reductase